MRLADLRRGASDGTGAHCPGWRQARELGTGHRELQRDWARKETVQSFKQILFIEPWNE
jgi:hypothetical protein